MTTRNVEATLRVDADISDAVADLARLRDRAEQVGRDINRATAGTAGAAVRTTGRAAGGIGTIGRTVAAGAGIGAGLAAAEQLFARLFELFEDTPLLEDFTGAFQTLLRAIAPIAGVVITALTPAIEALEPALTALAPAIAPLVELMGAGLLLAVKALTPAIELIARAMEYVNRFVRDVVIGLLDWLGRQLSRIPGVDIDLAGSVRTDTFAGVQRQLEDVERQRAMDMAAMADRAAADARAREESLRQELAASRPCPPQNISVTLPTRVQIDGDSLRTTIRRDSVRESEYGS